MLDLLKGTPGGLLASAIPTAFQMKYGRLMDLSADNGTSVPMRDVLWYHPYVEVVPEGSGGTAHRLRYLDNPSQRTSAGVSPMHRVQSRIIELLGKPLHRDGGIESSLLPGAYLAEFKEPLLLTDLGKKVPLAALIRYHPLVTTTPYKTGVKYSLR